MPTDKSALGSAGSRLRSRYNKDVGTAYTKTIMIQTSNPSFTYTASVGQNRGGEKRGYNERRIHEWYGMLKNTASRFSQPSFVRDSMSQEMKADAKRLLLQMPPQRGPHVDRSPTSASFPVPRRRRRRLGTCWRRGWRRRAWRR